MPQRLTNSRLANLGANAIHAACNTFQNRFKAITRRARTRFEGRDWHGMQADAAERLDLYRQVVNHTIAEISQLLEDRVGDTFVWASIKAVYSGLIAERDDWEIAETFFNSITRRVFATVGVDHQIEFVDTDFEAPPTQAHQEVYRTYEGGPNTAALIESILADHQLDVACEDMTRDAQLAAARIDNHLQVLGVQCRLLRAEMITSVFFRNKGAYLVGRIRSDSQIIPLVIALLNTPQGVVIDAVLLRERAVNILFSFTRSYFHVDVERPYDLVCFLRSVMPRKRIAEIYTAIGYHKHGKTELYRDLLHHLAACDEHFEVARGQRGMVMAVFTLPSYDVVFKVIKDHFDAPKDTTRQAVMEKYNLVFKHDRAGRLVDAQEFEHLEFDRWRFSDTLLDHLQHVAAQTVIVEAARVVVRHVYVERRVTPLNLYLHEADKDATRAAVVDYGYALKDLAATNIFPGDMLLKNFGVTRQGRVVFYDYDELCLLTDCAFRSLPQPTNPEEEVAAEPWFAVDEHDIFPEELQRFLGLQPALRDVFIHHHADLFTTQFWQQIQARLHAGEMLDIFPYSQNERLRASPNPEPHLQSAESISCGK
jgi:isocitrate dehydrogenase kinase/phosphatase